MAGLEVLEFAVHGGVEELDDCPAVVGLFEDDLPEGLDKLAVCWLVLGWVLLL
ncbi:MAG: hypothetical protein OXD31_18925 [Chloroflexi bacterium]|nr:hypothetical protein [Chloroflexota bacterium]